MRFLAALFLLLRTGLLPCPAGLVETADGRTLTGDLYATNGLLTVVRSNLAPTSIPLSGLLTARWEEGEPGGGPARALPGAGLLGYYFTATNTASACLVRLDESIDFDWGGGGPAPGLPKDLFTVVWTGEVEAPATGPFTFTLGHDDLGQLYLQDRLIVEGGRHTSYAEMTSAPVRLQAGVRYPIRVHFTDLLGPARVGLLWAGPGLSRRSIAGPYLHPAGMNSNHVAALTPGQGLVATYHDEPEFTGHSITRTDREVNFDWNEMDPLPGIGRTNFSVRWTGQVKADYTEEYTFYATSDERVRLWLDGRRLIDRSGQAWLAESRESIPLVAGERYDLVLETASTGGGAAARLWWSSASVGKTNIPASHLFPSRPAREAAALQETGDRLPAGILLRNGTFLAGEVEQGSSTSIKIVNRLRPQPLTAVNVARILCQPLAPGLASRLVPGRTGVLLTKGDFVDGEFRGLERGKVSVSSVLFGTRSFDARTEVMAVVLHEVGADRSTFEVRLADRSRIHPSLLTLEPEALKLEDSILGSLRLPFPSVKLLQRRALR